MRKRERLPQLVFVYLAAMSLAAISVSAQEGGFRISPTSQYVAEENFIRVFGVTEGTASNVVHYALGELTADVPAQPSCFINADGEQICGQSVDAWVPGIVVNNEGTWNVSFIATDTDQTVRTYGPITFTVNGTPAFGGGFTIPEVVVGEASSAAGGTVTYDDGGAGCSPASGSFFAMGPTTVNCGSAGSFSVIVTDTVPPVITVPASFATADHHPTWTVTATDNIDLTVPADNIACDPASGSEFPDGVTVVQCGAQDAHANYAFGSFSITVGLPVLHLPDPITAEATSAAGAVVTYTATADGADSFSCSPASGSTFPLGTTTVNCTATNVVGTSTGSFTVTVQDTTPPAIVSIDATPREVLWPNNHKMQHTTIVVVATDAVDAHPTARVLSVTSDQPENDGGDGDTSPDWAITGDLTVDLRSERSFGLDRHYTITVEVKDFSGNTSTGTLVISVHP
jgi:hypothetical protein